MSTLMDMSLEDIIQNNKTKNKSINKKNLPQHKVQKVAMTDARNKIISKQRTRITDAREILAGLAKKKDARLKLEQLRKRKGMIQTQGFNERVFINPSRQVVSQPLIDSRRRRKQNKFKKDGFMENRAIERRTLDKMYLKPILRTVHNDIRDYPMEDEYKRPAKIALSNHKAGLQLKIVARSADTQHSINSGHRITVVEKEKSPPKLQSILKKRPMAALRSDQIAEKSDKPTLEYRIIVSNLRSTVTGGDIEELFGDVGGMVESRLVRPGTAEVIYKSSEDAQKAVDLYHNRQLDGQPMNCLLVTPRSTATPKTTKPALYSTNSNVEPDLSTFHKVLFSNF